MSINSSRIQKQIPSTRSVVETISVESEAGLRIEGKITVAVDGIERVTFKWNSKYQSPNTWEVSGEGAKLPSGGRVPNTRDYPFTMDPNFNKGVKAIIADWLTQRRQLNPSLGEFTPSNHLQKSSVHRSAPASVGEIKPATTSSSTGNPADSKMSPPASLSKNEDTSSRPTPQPVSPIEPKNPKPSPPQATTPETRSPDAAIQPSEPKPNERSVMKRNNAVAKNPKLVKLVVSWICQDFNVLIDDVMDGAKRTAPLPLVRKAISYVVREVLEESIEVAAEAAGIKGPGTVYANCSAVKKLVEEDRDLRRILVEIKRRVLQEKGEHPQGEPPSKGSSKGSVQPQNGEAESFVIYLLWKMTRSSNVPPAKVAEALGVEPRRLYEVIGEAVAHEAADADKLIARIQEHFSVTLK